MSVEITLPVGRLVGGHPMKSTRNTDKKGIPLFWRDGVTPSMTSFVAVAIPKAGETNWNETVWGQQIVAEAFVAWPNGQHQYPDFAWKIVDGDSQIPGKPYKGKPGKIPAQSEGYPGNWVIKASTQLNINCFHVGKYAPHEQIQNQQEIKPGDYCRIVVTVKGNGIDSETPGMYINPDLFELTRAGQLIQLGDGPDAQAAFGGSAPVLPANAQLAPEQPLPAAVPGNPPPMPTPGAPQGMPTPGAPQGMPTPGAPQGILIPPAPPVEPHPGMPTPGAPPAPHPGILAPPVAPPEPQYDVNGTRYSRQQLVDAGFTEEHFASMISF